MIQEKSDLERRLDVSKGDLVLLVNSKEKREACGYVKKIRKKYVVLSHEHPDKRLGFIYEQDNELYVNYSTPGNRKFYLMDYTDYQILRQNKPK